ncbi:MAG TPA: phenylalanine--tRNA ligase subunit alpha [Solirubrobacterales bacterium]|nr:phenylalanine--tRNA ligase subunit alpha [Solirubrobacterales bacterium]
MVERIAQISDEATEQIGKAASSDELEQLRVRFLGRKAELTTILRGISELPADERGPVGKAGNEVRQRLEGLIETRAAELDASELSSRLAEDRVDITLPGAPPPRIGHLHLITRTRRRIEDVMVGLGYRILEGPEVEIDYYNFTALNHPPGHPARMEQDTFYVAPGSITRAALESARDAAGADGGSETPDEELVMLRTHTSPMQVRAMEAAEPPLFIAVPGKCYRRDTIDATHLPMFHQVEGLAVAEDITLADLQGTLREMLRGLFGPGREARMRPHFFPFTEPSVEFDVSCFRCDSTGRLDDGSRCPLCKGIGWIEVGGAGMVDPNVFGFVADNGYDPERIQGFAFGFGIERMAMLLHGLPDLRLFVENDVRVLEQFA